MNKLASIFTLIVFCELSYASTIMPPNKNYIAESATNIFVGKIIRIETKEPKGRCNSVNNTTTIEVVENIRGKVEKPIELPVCAGNKAFNRILKKDSMYIFFLKKSGSEYKRLYPIGGIVEF